MIRWLVIAVLLAIACRWLFGKWPWQYLGTAPSRSRELARARRLLGVSREADARQIREAHRRLAATSHPDRGGSTARIAEINAARDLLLNQLANDPSEPKE
ncbi:MAG: J domain-containing protein [Erythrobacter sp.]|nr:J domain-containing protein [Erythrobacter sp.]